MAKRGFSLAVNMALLFSKATLLHTGYHDWLNKMLFKIMSDYNLVIPFYSVYESTERDTRFLYKAT